ncbi:MAG: gyrase inhibitor [Anaerocolumna sp.]|nr:gyrase inhibitor [Anaerocolumna sp.]
MNIENIPCTKVAYIKQVGPYGDNNRQSMDRLKAWGKGMNLLNEDSVLLGIAYDNPAFVESDKCRYDTCLIIAEDYVINDTCIQEGRIQGGKYAVFQIEHTAEAVEEAWNTIFSTINYENCQLDEGRPIMERYHSKLLIAHYCEICVPIH